MPSKYPRVGKRKPGVSTAKQQETKGHGPYSRQEVNYTITLLGVKKGEKDVRVTYKLHGTHAAVEREARAKAKKRYPDRRWYFATSHNW